MKIFINILTVSRVLLGAVIFLLLTRTDLYFTALLLFFIAGITDYFDGYLARKYDEVSEIGEILDPIADKILIVFLLFAISVSISSFYIAFAGAIIITREIWVGALRDFNASSQVFCNKGDIFSQNQNNHPAFYYKYLPSRLSFK